MSWLAAIGAAIVLGWILDGPFTDYIGGEVKAARAYGVIGCVAATMLWFEMRHLKTEVASIRRKLAERS